MLYNRDAGEIFLAEKSIDLFFMNPPYLESYVGEYGGETQNHFNLVNDEKEYVTRLMRLVRHVEHALTDSGSAFIMLPNDENSVILELCKAVLAETKLKLGKFYVWDFSGTPHLDGVQGDKMGIILHFHNGAPHVDPSSFDYVLKTPIDDPEVLGKYRDLGFINSLIPVKLYENFINGFSKPGDTVCDLVGGTGTVIVAAHNLGRDFVYNDISSEQLAVATARLADLTTN